ncbi:hypothetical protein PM082_020844 [Marasmius tenuissimus]|nr:hypothetical protein PM082_020844 [Marasmius tenuissimus]
MISGIQWSPFRLGRSFGSTVTHVRVGSKQSSEVLKGTRCYGGTIDSTASAPCEGWHTELWLDRDAWNGIKRCIFSLGSVLKLD